MASAPANPHPIPLTESEVLIRGFLAANPDLDAKLGPVTMMTDRYTNEEWAAQIKETQRAVLKEVESGERARKVYEGPRMKDGKEALKQLALTVDHTVLKLDATTSAIDGLCSEARTEGFKSVCVRLNWVQRCISNLKGSPVVVACVVGFHEGTQDTYSKLKEARAAVEAGAAELDLVLNHALLTKHNKPASPDRIISSKDSAIDSITAANTAANVASTAAPDDEEIPDYSAIYRELASIRSLCPSPVVLKLILETSQLSDAQILAASHLAAAANFDFIKTSTGFNGHGATLPHVQLMVGAAEYLARQGVGSKKMEVKASGGVRSLETAVKMLEAGATRLGTSSGLWIMQEARTKVGEEKGRQDGERPPQTRLYTDDSVAGEY
ncbi:phosphodeoxyriboaldolase [Parastagonospora nodorum]|nr:phosphodeoxyriboaldolase [Parastagonospora nodorum]KAH5269715.1 phosphodeoxyriboaldolase [Parastagonospora nodorum]KAH5302750.1 phosphodeoxyriboaldolase [Parastagonospora nodorum]KAH5439752.1 phosphodeoxyriboaldolase [Parastagonospora nodorum]